ncbi:unnamed protein product, partial [Coregonus sp. 'balchen']
ERTLILRNRHSQSFWASAEQTAFCVGVSLKDTEREGSTGWDANNGQVKHFDSSFVVLTAVKTPEVTVLLLFMTDYFMVVLTAAPLWFTVRKLASRGLRHSVRLAASHVHVTTRDQVNVFDISGEELVSGGELVYGWAEDTLALLGHLWVVAIVVGTPKRGQIALWWRHQTGCSRVNIPQWIVQQHACYLITGQPEDSAELLRVVLLPRLLQTLLLMDRRAVNGQHPRAQGPAILLGQLLQAAVAGLCIIDRRCNSRVTEYAAGQRRVPLPPLTLLGLGLDSSSLPCPQKSSTFPEEDMVIPQEEMVVSEVRDPRWLLTGSEPVQAVDQLVDRIARIGLNLRTSGLSPNAGLLLVVVAELDVVGRRGDVGVKHPTVINRLHRSLWNHISRILHTDQLEDIRCHAEACLYSTGSVLEVRAGISAMANIPLPPSVKYCYIAAETMIIENGVNNNRQETIGSLQRLSTALNILEKYGCNLTSSSRPKYWRTVKHNNPVFRATVDAIQGGRAVLGLYGYSNQQPDGLSFPDEVVEPDIEKVAAVTLEVMSLRMELDMLIKEAHPHPEFFERIIPSLNQKDDFGPISDAVAIPSSLRESQPLYMSLASLSQSSTSAFLPVRTANASTSTSISTRHTDNCTICAIFPVAAHCNSCVQWLCTECDRLYHFSAERANHHRTVVTSSKMRKNHSSSLPSWHCTHCNRVNSNQDILCETCERPRLASSGSAKNEFPQPSTITVLGMPGDPDSQWVCQFCTYVNYTPASVCEMCDLPRPEPAKMRVKLHPPSQVRRVPVLSVKPKDPPMEDPDLRRQKRIREEGLKLIQLIRDGEKKGVSPEEVYTGMRVSGNGNTLPCDWLKAELPHLLDQICATATSSRAALLKTGQNQNGSGTAEDTGVEEEQPRGGGVTLSRAEAKLAWLSAGGDTERAARQGLRDRHAKVKELCSLGFTDEARCQEVLRQSEGEVRGALSLLQRPLMEPFHQRMWSDQPEPPIDINHPDKQHVCRRLLAVYDLPSWGRCELALSLLQERTAPYSLDDVVQAVRESHDRDFIRRVLAKECPICLSDFPHSKMQSLTSCQCSVCCGCFQQHFTIAVRDKHIRDMVCPVCWEPDINDPEHLNSYFSTLDIQLRECLEPEVYELFHKKLTEQALIKDPKFLWCSHWESQHGGVSCERYQSWKRQNDPEYQRQGLAGYLRDNGITCPNCRFQYALSKGGCMHFSCSQCRYQFCSGCNNPFHTTCAVIHCSVTGLHAHHPRDCLFYLRDWEPGRLQALLQNKNVEFNTDTPPGTQAGLCGVIEQKDEGGQQMDSACGAQTQPGHAGLCEKHYREYLVSLINGHSIDPAPLFNANELVLACRRYQVDDARGEMEDDMTYYTRILEKLIDEVPLGDKVPRKK